MVSPEILSKLVPPEIPKSDFEPPSWLRREGIEEPVHRLGLWAAYLRHTAARQARRSERLMTLIESSGFVGVGIFRTNGNAGQPAPAFPAIDGYQFGIILFRAAWFEGETMLPGIWTDDERTVAPLVQTLATFDNHAHASADGYTAAVFEPSGDSFGITARHVVEPFRPGERVPIACSDCGRQARLVRKAPGLIDAAVVRFPCGGPGIGLSSSFPLIRSAIEGEPVDAHLGGTGRRTCTVMMSLSTPAQILSAATPKHFLLDQSGVFGDSGSLVSSEKGVVDPPDLIGMYLGACDCEDASGLRARYGYALDLKQAAAILGANDLKGEYK